MMGMGFWHPLAHWFWKGGYNGLSLRENCGPYHIKSYQLQVILAQGNIPK
jgi:hypothetical protein